VSKGLSTSLFQKILIHRGYSDLDPDAKAETDYKMMLVSTHSVCSSEGPGTQGTVDFPAL
jgi:hypothetical protein